VHHDFDPGFEVDNSLQHGKTQNDHSPRNTIRLVGTNETNKEDRVIAGKHQAAHKQ